MAGLVPAVGCGGEYQGEIPGVRIYEIIAVPGCTHYRPALNKVKLEWDGSILVVILGVHN